MEPNFPALGKGAGQLSADSQRDYLWSLRVEYALLIVCALMSGRSGMDSWYYYLYTFLFSLALALFVWRFIVKPEQSWYQGRALAESIKTSSWRFCMRASPFDDDDATANAEFRDHLQAILDANEFAGKKLPAQFAAEDQITPEMCALRAKSFEDRMTVYEEQRIRDQRKWYAAKAGNNKIWVKRWVSACILIYGCAIASGLYQANNPDLSFSPTEVLIAIAASIVGWIQIKKFNELAASYILTAHEIGILHGAFSQIEDEKEFLDFVNDAEQAFSREHTQWVARSES